MPDFGDLIPLVALSIPVIAIIGGIASGIVKTLGKQRLLELMQKERIAAIERGIDPTRLPPLPVDTEERFKDRLLEEGFGISSKRAQSRAQDLLVGGIITATVGISIGVFLWIMVDGDPAWAVGLIPTGVGLALILSSILVRPRRGEPRGSAPPRPAAGS